MNDVFSQPAQATTRPIRIAVAGLTLFAIGVLLILFVRMTTVEVFSSLLTWVAVAAALMGALIGLLGLETAIRQIGAPVFSPLSAPGAASVRSAAQM